MKLLATSLIILLVLSALTLLPYTNTLAQATATPQSERNTAATATVFSVTATQRAATTDFLATQQAIEQSATADVQSSHQSLTSVGMLFVGAVIGTALAIFAFLLNPMLIKETLPEPVRQDQTR